MVAQVRTNIDHPSQGATSASKRRSQLQVSASTSAPYAVTTYDCNLHASCAGLWRTCECGSNGVETVLFGRLGRRRGYVEGRSQTQVCQNLKLNPNLVCKSRGELRSAALSSSVTAGIQCMISPSRTTKMDYTAFRIRSRPLPCSHWDSRPRPATARQSTALLNTPGGVAVFTGVSATRLSTGYIKARTTDDLTIRPQEIVSKR